MITSTNTSQQTKAAVSTATTRSQWANDLGAALANKTQVKPERERAIAEFSVFDNLAIKAALGVVNGLIWGIGVLPNILKLGGKK